jgi:hypothetical protein
MSPDAIATLPADRRLIVAAGAVRSGSTMLYNIARLLLAQQGPLTAGSYRDLAEPLGSTVLVKIHRCEPAMAKRANIVLTCHRDLRDVVRSLAGMGWLSTGPTLFDQIGQIVHQHSQWKPIAAADVAYEAMMRDLRASVVEIASVLGVDAAHTDIDAVVRTVSAMPSPATLPEGQPHDFTTLMHVNHRRIEAATPLPVENDIHERFLDWQTAHGYARTDRGRGAP